MVLENYNPIRQAFCSMLLKLTNEYAATYGASTSSMEIVTYIENLPLNSSVRGFSDEMIKENRERMYSEQSSLRNVNCTIC